MADVESGIYAEDIVRNSQGNLGLVLQDAEETTDESDSEDEALKKGQLLICWYPSGNEETVAISKVRLADRSLLPGDVVKHVNQSRPLKQKGFINDVEVVSSVKVVAANQVVTNVDCRELEPLQELVHGVHVTLGPWLGLITDSQQRVVLRVKNGARCHLEGEQVEMLYDMTDQRDEDSPFYSVTFYPGQLVAGPARTFKDAKWLSGSKPILHNQTQVKATVEEVTVIACEVNWQVCGACQDGTTSIMPPDPNITKDQLSKLKVVNHYRHASIQIGDKAFYTVKPKDMEMAASHYNNSGNSSLKPLPLDEAGSAQDASLCQSPLSDSLPEDGEPGACGGRTGNEDSEIAGSDEKPSVEEVASKVQDVALTDNKSKDETSQAHNKRRRGHKGQQGHKRDTHDHGSDSGDADEDSDGAEPEVPKTKGPKHDASSGTAAPRFPKRKRRRNRRKRKAPPQIHVNVGDKVCIEVTSTQTLVDVIWQDGSKEDHILSTDLIPVFHLDEQEFFPGDYVNDKRDTADSSVYGTVLTTDCASRTCDVKWFTRDGIALQPEQDVSVYDIAEHADFVFNAGDIAVRVIPPESLSLHTDDEDAGKEASAPTPCIGQVTSVDELGNVHIRWVDGSLSQTKPQELYKVDPEEDGQSFTIGSESREGTDDEWETASDVSTDEGSRDQDLIIGYSSPEAENVTGDEGPGESNDVRDDNNKINEIMSNRNPAFMMMECAPACHAFKNTQFTPENQRRFLTCVRKELALLQSSLPDGILVRGYEDRMDLFRVMICGPAGTPYDHGLFVFDIRLPADYPASPPIFHYLSMCSGRLNPNLYEDGKVCVSLLGTWSGRGSEVWTSKSNVLQVLISIQGLILSNEPYYNEAGYEKQRGTAEGRENSRLYNEMVILKLLQSMEKMMSRPPDGFDKEILQHFLQNADQLIQKLTYWIAHYEGSSPEKTSQSEDAKGRSDPPANTEPSVNGGKDNGTIDACAEAGKEQSSTNKLPEFPLFPLSKGICKSLNRSLEKFKEAFEKAKQSNSDS